MVNISPTLEKIGIAGYRLIGFESNHGVAVHVEPEAKPTLADLLKLGQATIERIYHQFTERKASERISLNCPILLGIDEHTNGFHTSTAPTATTSPKR